MFNFLPFFFLTVNSFIFHVFRDNVTETKATFYLIILELLKENPMCSREEIAGIIVKTVRTVQRVFNELSLEGKNKRVSIILLVFV